MTLIPAATRRAVRHRSRGACEDCGADDRPLELHHLRYLTEGDPGRGGQESIFGQEQPEDLAALCRDCHHDRHLDPAGEFWSDPEEKATAWATWFDR